MIGLPIAVAVTTWTLARAAGPASPQPSTPTSTQTSTPPFVPAPPVELDPTTVTPGVLGFTVTLLLGIATYLLIRSMNRHLRKIPRD
jgi:hypothetical protein